MWPLLLPPLEEDPYESQLYKDLMGLSKACQVACDQVCHLVGVAYVEAEGILTEPYILVDCCGNDEESPCNPKLVEQRSI